MTEVVNIKNTREFDVYIGRGTKWGNPYKIGRDGTRSQVIAKFEYYLLNNEKLLREVRHLKDKILGCHCAPLACHGHILAKYAEGAVDSE